MLETASKTRNEGLTIAPNGFVHAHVDHSLDDVPGDELVFLELNAHTALDVDAKCLCELAHGAVVSAGSAAVSVVQLIWLRSTERIAFCASRRAAPSCMRMRVRSFSAHDEQCAR